MHEHCVGIEVLYKATCMGSQHSKWHHLKKDHKLAIIDFFKQNRPDKNHYIFPNGKTISGNIKENTKIRGSH